ncbi:hypothetical protein AMAG_00747 [Allomyces macrogynus ATCC 38327]|uniref:Uncharacterized protein n=1 Tax=Allomyces macrogynus (strain ATCC 38327) TaxID=578462 RepID=A0A0L0RWR4_ALLM3|nr:hypothetical protein AMAG_00747 [Allomyces macrogynus ATCC 38327]|eukprot:KNE54793.1 hypothetical protein AMAG_00747 [Allomyces macrogynus ATCC 38327]
MFTDPVTDDLPPRPSFPATTARAAAAPAPTGPYGFYPLANDGRSSPFQHIFLEVQALRRQGIAAPVTTAVGRPRAPVTARDRAADRLQTVLATAPLDYQDARSVLAKLSRQIHSAQTPTSDGTEALTDAILRRTRQLSAQRQHLERTDDAQGQRPRLSTFDSRGPQDGYHADQGPAPIAALTVVAGGFPGTANAVPRQRQPSRIPEPVQTIPSVRKRPRSPPPSRLAAGESMPTTAPIAAPAPPRPPSPLRPPNKFYNVRLSQNPVFLRRTSMKPPHLAALPSPATIPAPLLPAPAPTMLTPTAQRVRRISRPVRPEPAVTVSVQTEPLPRPVVADAPTLPRTRSFGLTTVEPWPVVSARPPPAPPTPVSTMGMGVQADPSRFYHDRGIQPSPPWPTLPTAVFADAATQCTTSPPLDMTYSVVQTDPPPRQITRQVHTGDLVAVAEEGIQTSPMGSLPPSPPPPVPVARPQVTSHGTQTDAPSPMHYPPPPLLPTDWASAPPARPAPVFPVPIPVPETVPLPASEPPRIDPARIQAEILKWMEQQVMLRCLTDDLFEETVAKLVEEIAEAELQRAHQRRPVTRDMQTVASPTADVSAEARPSPLPPGLDVGIQTTPPLPPVEVPAPPTPSPPPAARPPLPPTPPTKPDPVVPRLVLIERDVQTSPVPPPTPPQLPTPSRVPTPPPPPPATAMAEVQVSPPPSPSPPPPLASPPPVHDAQTQVSTPARVEAATQLVPSVMDVSISPATSLALPDPEPVPPTPTPSPPESTGMSLPPPSDASMSPPSTPQAFSTDAPPSMTYSMDVSEGEVLTILHSEGEVVSFDLPPPMLDHGKEDGEEVVVDDDDDENEFMTPRKRAVLAQKKRVLGRLRLRALNASLMDGVTPSASTSSSSSSSLFTLPSPPESAAVARQRVVDDADTTVQSMSLSLGEIPEGDEAATTAEPSVDTGTVTSRTATTTSATTGTSGTASTTRTSSDMSGPHSDSSTTSSTSRSSSPTTSTAATVPIPPPGHMPPSLRRPVVGLAPARLTAPAATHASHVSHVAGATFEEFSDTIDQLSGIAAGTILEDNEEEGQVGLMNGLGLPSPAIG